MVEPLFAKAWQFAVIQIKLFCYMIAQSYLPDSTGLVLIG